MVHRIGPWFCITNEELLYTEKEKEGEKSLFLRKVDHDWRTLLLVHLLLIPTGSLIKDRKNSSL